VFYHPDLHTHDSCLGEIGNCHLFVLVIGGRFGGSYISDPKKSIVNAEYSAARQLGVPVFTFVKRDVWDDHRLYQKNKTKSEIKKIDFPSIDRRENAENIFAFIDEVRLAKVNNGFFTFEVSRDIEKSLRKQWAGMFFEALQQRRLRGDYEIQHGLLTKLTSMSEQMDQLVKKIYESVDAKDAPAVIDDVEKRAEAMEFFRELEAAFQRVLFPGSTAESLLKVPRPQSWQDFLIATSHFRRLETQVKYQGETEPQPLLGLTIKTLPLAHLFTAGFTSTQQPTASRLVRLQKSYSVFLALTYDQQYQVLTEFLASNESAFPTSSAS